MSLWKCICKQPKLNLVVLFWQVVGAVCVTVNGLGNANLVSSIVKLDRSAVIFWLIVVLVANISWGCQIKENRIWTERAMQAMDADIRLQITTQLAATDYATYHQTATATYVSWLTNDIATINDYGFETLVLVIYQALIITMSVGALIHFHYSLIVTVGVLLLLMSIVPQLFTKRMNQATLTMSQATEKFTSQMTDLLAGFDELLQLNQPIIIQRLTSKATDKLAHAKINQARVDGTMMGTSNLVSLVSQVVVMGQACLLFFVKLVPVGAISGAQYFAATIFANLTGLMANLVEMKTVRPIFAKYQLPAVADTLAPHLMTTEGKLQLTDLNYCYPANPQTSILQRFSWQLQFGKKYAVTGPSGCGKSTLLNIIAGRLATYTGQGSYDQQDYRQLSPAAIRQEIVYLSQTPHIFSASLLFNITLGQVVDAQRLNEALAFSGLKQMTTVFPAGVQTLIEQSGQQLSGGQREQIALARGYYLN
ncbi:ATP-binding cassette domain-containing protein [Lapidilactobacillus gannanensis]|uniref:ATP-binding cassette domain-containing protein n=1 Tax=Lapidilactobacillus gannanensis TaxID=2486002 RepID=A0ABW4BLC6_9LACO|nr:ABC transporter ATP-binding protein [Lapidilactobacillus gannanensis]